MSYYRYPSGDGGDGYILLAKLLFVVAVLFVFGMAIGAGIEVMR
jgi:hypothetical protein